MKDEDFDRIFKNFDFIDGDYKITKSFYGCKIGW